MTTIRELARGAVAGAAGATALNMVTYLDMAVRGRPASSTPEQTVDRLTSLVGLHLPGPGPQRDARRSGLGAVLGSAAGIGAGVATAAVRCAVGPGPAKTLMTSFGIAMLVGNGPMTLLRVTDPASWSAEDWLSDVLPHVAYAAVTTSALEMSPAPR